MPNLIKQIHIKALLKDNNKSATNMIETTIKTHAGQLQY